MVDLVCEKFSSTAEICSMLDDGATFAGSCPLAAASNSQNPCGAGSVNAPYIVVQFDDGPESGLLAETCEEDHCDPQFWRFQEVHCRPPKAKILFDDGVTLFVAELPAGLEGSIADEDGDEHGFIRAERAQVLGAPAPERARRPRQRASTEASRPAGLQEETSSTVTRRTAGGGYGHVTVEAVAAQEDDDVDGAQLKSAKRKRQRDKQEKDEDWAPDKRRPRPASGTEAASVQRTKRQKRVVANDSDDDVKSSTTAIVVAEPSLVQGACEVDAACSGQSLAADPGDLMAMDRGRLEALGDVGGEGLDACTFAEGANAGPGHISSMGAEASCDVQANIASHEHLQLPIVAAPVTEPKNAKEDQQSDSDVEVVRAEGVPASDGAKAAAQAPLANSTEDDSDDFEMHVVK